MVDNYEPYRPLMESLTGRRVMYVQMPGNPGDDLISTFTPEEFVQWIQ